MRVQDGLPQMQAAVGVIRVSEPGDDSVVRYNTEGDLMNDWEKQEQARAFVAVQALMEMANPMTFEPDHFIGALAREHRTLQQSVTRAMLAWLGGSHFPLD